MSWDLFVMDLPEEINTADALPPKWVPGPLPARDEIIRAILEIDPTADASDPAWLRVKGPDFSVEISISDQTPLTQFACHIRGADPAVGFIATLLDRLHLRALDPGSTSGLFDPATAAASQTSWREYRNRIAVEQLGATQKGAHSTDFPFTVVARLTDSIQPVARGAKYEDPLDAALKQQGCGRVTGAGSTLNERYEIAFVDVEMSLANLEDALALARTTLLTLGAPMGSALHFMRDGKPRALPIHGNGPESDSPKARVGLTRRRMPTPQPGPSTYDPAVISAKAAKILASFERLFAVQPERVPVDLGTRDPVTVAWYDGVTREFAVEGFRMLGDFTSVSIAARKERLASAFSRKFLSTDGRVRATAIYMPAAKPRQPDTRVIGLNSDVDDGTCLRTTTSADQWDCPEHLLIEHLPRETPIPVISARHRARLEPHPFPNGNHHVIVMQSLEDVFASEDRSQSLTSAFRRRRGIPSIDELLRFGVARPLAELMHAAMKNLKSRNGDGT